MSISEVSNFIQQAAINKHWPAVQRTRVQAWAQAHTHTHIDKHTHTFLFEKCNTAAASLNFFMGFSMISIILTFVHTNKSYLHFMEGFDIQNI